MRKVQLSANDFEIFDTEIGPGEFEFFKQHNGAFKRMWNEQGRPFWIKFIISFRAFASEHGFIKNFTGRRDTYAEFLDTGFIYIHEQFVDGHIGKCRELMTDVVVVSQTRSLLQFLQSKSVTKDPFYRKETKESYRKLYGPPNEKSSYLKAFCLYPLYSKFAGGVCVCLKRWINAETISSDDESWWTPPANALTSPSDADKEIEEARLEAEYQKEVAVLEESFKSLAELERARFIYELPKEAYGLYVYYVRELFNKHSNGPHFVAGWTSDLDPRFNVPCNILYHPDSPFPTWKQAISFQKYCRFTLHLISHCPTKCKNEREEKRLSPRIKQYIWEKIKAVNEARIPFLNQDEENSREVDALLAQEVDLSDQFDNYLLMLRVGEEDNASRPPGLDDPNCQAVVHLPHHVHCCPMDTVRIKKKKGKSKKKSGISCKTITTDDNPPKVIDILYNNTDNVDFMKRVKDHAKKKDANFIRILRWQGKLEIQEIEEGFSNLPQVPASIQYVCQGRDASKPLLTPDEMPNILTLLVIPKVVVERCARAAGCKETMTLEFPDKTSKYYQKLEKLLKSEYSALLVYTDTKNDDYRVNPVFYDPATRGCLVQGVQDPADFAIHVMDTVNDRNKDKLGESVSDMVNMSQIESKLPWFPTNPLPSYSEPRRPIEEAPPIREDDVVGVMNDRTMMIFSLIFPNESRRTSVLKGIDSLLHNKNNALPGEDDPDYWDLEKLKHKYEGNSNPKQAMEYEHRRRRLLKKLEQRKTQGSEAGRGKDGAEEACGDGDEDYKPEISKMRIVNDELRKVVHLMQLSRGDDSSDAVQIMEMAKRSQHYKDALELETHDATSLRPGLVAHHFIKKKLFHSDCLGMPNLAMVAEARHMYYWEQFCPAAPSNGCKKSVIRKWYNSQAYEEELDLLEAMVSEVVKAPELYADLPLVHTSDGKLPREPIIPKIPIPPSVEKLSKMDPLIALIDLKMTKAFLDRVRHVSDEDALKAMDQLIDMPLDGKKLFENMYIFDAIRKVALTAENKQAVQKAAILLTKIEKIKDFETPLEKAAAVSNLDKGMDGSPTKAIHRTCSQCGAVEPEPRMYKKCQRCKTEALKNSRYYCGRDCQVTDWAARHKREHKDKLLK